MADNDIMGVGEQYGLFSPRQLAQQRGRRNIQAAQESVGGLFRDPWEAMAANIGAGVGSALADKYAGPGEDEQRMGAIYTSANNKFQQYKQAGLYEGLAPEEEALEYERMLAKEASAAGDNALAAKIGMSYAQKQAALRAQKLELKKLGIATDVAEKEANVWDKRYQTEQYGKEQTYFVPSPDGDISNATTVFGQLNENGEIVDPEGNVLAPRGFTFDQAMQLRDRQLKALKEGKTKAFDLKDFKDIYGASNMAKAREQMMSGKASLELAEDMAGSISDMLDAGISPEASMGWAGSVVDMTNNIKSFFTGVQGAFIPEWGITNAPSSKSMEQGERLYGSLDEAIKDGDYTSYVQVPDGMVAKEAAVYKSRIVELAYAVARAQEPGARQLSDNDFRNALRVIGASSGNPATLANTLMELSMRNHRKIDDTWRSVGAIGSSLLGEGGGQKAIDITYGRTLHQDYFRKYNDVDNIYKALIDRLDTEEPAVEAAPDALYQSNSGITIR